MQNEVHLAGWDPTLEDHEGMDPFVDIVPYIDKEDGKLKWQPAVYCQMVIDMHGTGWQMAKPRFETHCDGNGGVTLTITSVIITEPLQ